VTFNATNFVDSFVSSTETSTKTGSDEIKYTIQIDGVWYYTDGVNAIVSTDQTGTSYAESSTNTQWSAIWSTWDPAGGVTAKIRMFLHSSDGTTTPSITNYQICYVFRGQSPDDVETCLVWGYSRNEDGTISTDTVTATMTKDLVKYKDNITLIKEQLTATPDSVDGYFEINPVENTNMDGFTKTKFTIAEKEFIKTVPNEANKAFWELED
jgi:hypothetical protein